MNTVKIFYKDDCPYCPMAKTLRDSLLEKKVDVHAYNVGTAEGLAEAAFYQVMAIPAIIVEDDKECSLGEWRGSVPKVEDILHVVQGA